MYFIHYSNYKYVKTPRILTWRDHVPGFKIPGSATVLDLKSISKMPNSHRRWNSVTMRVGVGVMSPQPPYIINMCKK